MRLHWERPPGVGGPGFADKWLPAGKGSKSEVVKGGLPLIYNPDDSVCSGGAWLSDT